MRPRMRQETYASICCTVNYNLSYGLRKPYVYNWLFVEEERQRSKGHSIAELYGTSGTREKKSL